MLELSPTITRQYIDAVAVFDALAEATEEAAQVRGGMYWHAGPASSPQAQYLVRTSPAGPKPAWGSAPPRHRPSTTKSCNESRPAPNGSPA